MKVTVEEARNIVWEDTYDFDMVENKISSTSRWSVFHEGVCKHLESGKYYAIDWSVGATEMQDEGPFEHESGDIELSEVVQEEVKVMKWVGVK